LSEPSGEFAFNQTALMPLIMMVAMIMIRMASIGAHIGMIVLDATIMIVTIKTEPGIGGIMAVGLMTPIGVMVPVTSMIPVRPMAPIRGAIPVRIPRAICAIAFLRMMITEAEMRVIVRMIVAVRCALGVA
jgi:hypothetical protein